MKKLFIVCLMFLLIVPFAGADSVRPQEQIQYDVPIIMYHSTHGRRPGKFTVSPSQLEKDLIWIKENGFTTVTLGDVIAFKEKGKPLPEKPIILTFDDGYTNNYLNAYPLFKKHNMKCVISVIGYWTDQNYKGVSNDGKTSVKAETWAHLTYEQIKEMSDSGLVEIQNHTYDLHRTGRRFGLKKIKGENIDNYKEIVRSDLTKLHDKIFEKTGITMNAVTFPFGGYSNEAIEVLKEMGYKAALTCNEGVNKITRDADLFLLKRYNRPSGPSSEQFFGKIASKI